MSITDYTRLIQLFREAGVIRLYFKKLAANDNSKNQIYLGSDFQALNILPHHAPVREKANYKAHLNLAWLDDSGNLNEAPTAQLILYPQYPEVRMSGFLKGSSNAPNRLLTSRDEGRVMFLGVTPDDRILGYVTDRDNPISAAVDELPDTNPVGVFTEIFLGGASPQELLQKLAEIYRRGWIDSKRLSSDGTPVPCDASNCGGYTLEAELGVTPNGFPLPDYLGFEIKQYGVNNFESMKPLSPLTLMTPEPTGGFYVEMGVEAFVRRYGYLDKMGKENRMNFGGTYSIGRRTDNTGLTLTLKGYNSVKGTFNPEHGGIVLEDDQGETAALWSFSSLMEHWTNKHTRAGYVPSRLRIEPVRQYSYGHTISLGLGTDFKLFLDAMAAGSIYYDPGIKLENAFSGRPKTKRRSQFRIRVSSLDSLYRSWQEYDLAVW